MVVRSWATAVAVLLVLGCKAAQAQEMPPRVSWLNAPQASEADYPIVAGYLGIRANAAVNCIANAEGYARECVAVAHPEGFGFEDVALEIAKRGRIKANWPGDTTENLTFIFNLPFGDNLDDPLPPVDSWDGSEPTSSQLIHAQRIVETFKNLEGDTPYEGKAPPAIIAALATELAPENAAALLEIINTYGLTYAESDALSIRTIARTLTLPEVENRIERIVNFDDPEVRARVLKAEGGEGVHSSVWRIRNAYCSRYDCTSKRAEEPATPEHWQPRDDEPFPPYLPAG